MSITKERLVKITKDGGLLTLYYVTGITTPHHFLHTNQLFISLQQFIIFLSSLIRLIKSADRSAAAIQALIGS